MYFRVEEVVAVVQWDAGDKEILHFILTGNALFALIKCLKTIVINIFLYIGRFDCLNIVQFSISFNLVEVKMGSNKQI